MTSPVRAGGLVRDLDLLRALADVGFGDEGLGVMELAKAVDRDKSQVSRALRALESSGFVERDLKTLRYRLGVELLALVERAGPNRLIETAPAYVHALAEEIGGIVHLCSLAGTGVKIVGTAWESPYGFYLWCGEGPIVPAHCTSSGRVLLGDADPAVIEQRFADETFESPGPRGRVRDPLRLLEEVAKARRVGFATVDEEYEAGLIGASAPVRDHRGRIVAAVNATRPRDVRESPAEADRLVARRLESIGRACVRTASELSRAIGHRGAGW